MGLDSVVEDVLGRGRSEVEEIRRAALAERDRTLQNAQAEGAKLLEVREKEANAVRSAVGTSFGGTIDCVGGIVIESGDGTHRIDLRYETLLADVWRDSIREVAEVLWPRR